jgi:hypothetical protein
MQRATYNYTPPPEPGPGPAESEDEDEDDEKAEKNSILEYFLTSAAVASTGSPTSTNFKHDYNQILGSSVKTRVEISTKNDGIFNENGASFFDSAKFHQETPDA